MHYQRLAEPAGLLEAQLSGKVNKDTSFLLDRQHHCFASEGAWDGSVPHAVQEYFRILIAHLVCCCHMAFISIPSTQ